MSRAYSLVCNYARKITRVHDIHFETCEDSTTRERPVLEGRLATLYRLVCYSLRPSRGEKSKLLDLTVYGSLLSCSIASLRVTDRRHFDFLPLVKWLPLTLAQVPRQCRQAGALGFKKKKSSSILTIVLLHISAACDAYETRRRSPMLLFAHCQDSQEMETTSVKRVYESELNEARSLIDETAKEKAHYQIVASKHSERLADLEAE